MQIELSPEQSSFVDLGIQQGRFRDQEEAVRQALALWEKRERARIQLLADIDAGEASFEGSETVLESAEDIQKFVEGIATLGRDRLAKV